MNVNNIFKAGITLQQRDDILVDLNTASAQNADDVDVLNKFFKPHFPFVDIDELVELYPAIKARTKFEAS